MAHTTKTKTKQKQNTTCDGHHYAQANNVNKTWALLQKKLEVKVNRTSFLCGNRKLLTDIKTRNQERKDTQQDNNTKTKKITKTEQNVS